MHKVNQHTTIGFFYFGAAAQLDGVTDISANPLGRSGGQRIQTFNGTVVGDIGAWSPHQAMLQAGLINAGNTREGVPEEGYIYQGQRVHSYLLHSVHMGLVDPGTTRDITIQTLNTPGFDQDGNVLDVIIDRDDLPLGSNASNFFSGCRILTPNNRLQFSSDGAAAGVTIAIEIIPITNPGSFADICIANAEAQIN